MKKNIIIAISLIIVVAVMSLVIINMKTDEPKPALTADEIKFKNEYESLNGTEYKENYVLKNIEIVNDNNVEYVNDDELLELLTNGTNVIYMGWPECNWCRTVVPVLINTLKSNDIKTLYYYNLKSLRNAYEEDNDIKKVELYEKIVEILGDDIEATYDEGTLKEGKKKLLAPTVIFIKDNNYIGSHVSTVPTHTNASDNLTETEEKELKGIYQGFIDQINPNICVDDEGC